MHNKNTYDNKHHGVHMFTRLTIKDIQSEWRLLDSLEIDNFNNQRIISNDDFTPCENLKIKYIPPNCFVKNFKSFPLIYSLLYAIQLLYQCNSSTVMILNGSDNLLLFQIGFLNRLFCLRKRKIMLCYIYIDHNKKWKRNIFRGSLAGISLCLVWSRKQIFTHANYLDLPKEKFLFIPFKSNHSKRKRYNIKIDNFIFAGGNNHRDYSCLIEAVRDTDVPVIISSTNDKVLKTIERLPNVIVLSASEPAYAQLQAASRFVVVPLINSDLRGFGEANFCDGMWHGKPVIAADNISARDYIKDGETGYVVPSGDFSALRQKILKLWNEPEKVASMGEAARCNTEQNFTHSKFVKRLTLIALMLSE